MLSHACLDTRLESSAVYSACLLSFLLIRPRNSPYRVSAAGSEGKDWYINTNICPQLVPMVIGMRMVVSARTYLSWGPRKFVLKKGNLLDNYANLVDRPSGTISSRRLRATFQCYPWYHCKQYARNSRSYLKACRLEISLTKEEIYETYPLLMSPASSTLGKMKSRRYYWSIHCYLHTSINRPLADGQNIIAKKMYFTYVPRLICATSENSVSILLVLGVWILVGIWYNGTGDNLRNWHPTSASNDSVICIYSERLRVECRPRTELDIITSMTATPTRQTLLLNRLTTCIHQFALDGNKGFILDACHAKYTTRHVPQ